MRYQIRGNLDVRALSKYSIKQPSNYALLHCSTSKTRVKRCNGYSQHSLRNKHIPYVYQHLTGHFSMDSKRKSSISNGLGGSDGVPHRQSMSTQAKTVANDSLAEGSKSPTSTKSPQSLKSLHGKSHSMSGRSLETKESWQASSETNTMGSLPQQARTDLPDFIIRRNQLFDELKKNYDAELLQKSRPEIEVFLDLGRDRNGAPIPAMPVTAKAWESTPGSFLKHVPKELSTDVVIAKIDGKELWDLDRPLEYSCRVSYLPFSSAEGRNVFWHSSAHVLGEAAECQYNCLLSHGPPVEQGFFYDMAIADGSVPVYNLNVPC